MYLLTTDEKLLQTKSEGSDVSAATGQLTEDKHGMFLSAPAKLLGIHLTDKRHCCQQPHRAQNTMRGQCKIVAVNQMADNRQHILQVNTFFPVFAGILVLCITIA